MGLALFLFLKTSLIGQINAVQCRQMCVMDAQMRLSDRRQNLSQQISAFECCGAQEQQQLYAQLAECGNDSSKRASIEAKIKQIEAGTKANTSMCNTDLCELAKQDNALDIEREKLNTRAGILRAYLNSVKQGEENEIKDYAPKFC